MTIGSRNAPIPVGDETIIADISNVIKLPNPYVVKMMKYLYDEFRAILIEKKSFRIKGVGRLCVRKSTLGQWGGHVNTRFTDLANENFVKSAAVINNAWTRCNDPGINYDTYWAFWVAYCDCVAARLRYGYQVRLGSLGNLMPTQNNKQRFKLFISPLIQAMITQNELSSQFTDEPVTSPPITEEISQ